MNPKASHGSFSGIHSIFWTKPSLGAVTCCHMLSPLIFLGLSWLISSAKGAIGDVKTQDVHQPWYKKLGVPTRISSNINSFFSIGDPDESKMSMGQVVKTPTVTIDPQMPGVIVFFFFKYRTINRKKNPSKHTTHRFFGHLDNRFWMFLISAWHEVWFSPHGKIRNVYLQIITTPWAVVNFGSPGDWKSEMKMSWVSTDWFGSTACQAMRSRKSGCARSVKPNAATTFHGLYMSIPISDKIGDGLWMFNKCL